MIVETAHLPDLRLLKRLAERSVVVAITPWGLTGPFAESDRPWTEFTVQAEAGSLSNRGEPMSYPLALGGAETLWVAGSFAATAGLGARRWDGARRTWRAGRRVSSRGDHVCRNDVRRRRGDDQRGISRAHRAAPPSHPVGGAGCGRLGRVQSRLRPESRGFPGAHRAARLARRRGHQDLRKGDTADRRSSPPRCTRGPFSGP